MSESGLWLDPARAHRAGVDLALGGQAVSAARRRLGEEIATASAQRPWGRDDIGAAFDQRYRQFESTFLHAWQRLGGYVDELGADVVRSVRANVETDAANGQRIRRTAGPR